MLRAMARPSRNTFLSDVHVIWVTERQVAKEGKATKRRKLTIYLTGRESNFIAPDPSPDTSPWETRPPTP